MIKEQNEQHGLSGRAIEKTPSEVLLPKHGGHRKQKSFQIAQLVYDVTVRFCNCYVDKFSRTKDQMEQATQSGVQNIAEGSKASGTSKKTELKLTNVARASLEELRLDYEDFLRHRGLTHWERENQLRSDLINRRCTSVEEVAKWIAEVYERLNKRVQSTWFTKSIKSTGSTYPEISATAALVLIAVACSLLDRQLAAQAEAFEKEGGFTERLYQRRIQARRSQ